MINIHCRQICKCLLRTMFMISVHFENSKERCRHVHDPVLLQVIIPWMQLIPEWSSLVASELGGQHSLILLPPTHFKYQVRLPFHQNVKSMSPLLVASWHQLVLFRRGNLIPSAVSIAENVLQDLDSKHQKLIDVLKLRIACAAAYVETIPFFLHSDLLLQGLSKLMVCSFDGFAYRSNESSQWKGAISL